MISDRNSTGTGECSVSFLQDKVKLWLSTALKKEEESWLNNNTPETIDSYYFSPLAVDVIQVRHNLYETPVTQVVF